MAHRPGKKPGAMPGETKSKTGAKSSTTPNTQNGRSRIRRRTRSSKEKLTNREIAERNRSLKDEYKRLNGKELDQSEIVSEVLRLNEGLIGFALSESWPKSGNDEERRTFLKELLWRKFVIWEPNTADLSTFFLASAIRDSRKKAAAELYPFATPYHAQSFSKIEEALRDAPHLKNDVEGLAGIVNCSPNHVDAFLAFADVRSLDTKLGDTSDSGTLYDVTSDDEAPEGFDIELPEESEEVVEQLLCAVRTRYQDGQDDTAAPGALVENIVELSPPLFVYLLQHSGVSETHQKLLLLKFGPKMYEGSSPLSSAKLADIVRPGSTRELVRLPLLAASEVLSKFALTGVKTEPGENVLVVGAAEDIEEAITKEGLYVQLTLF